MTNAISATSIAGTLTTAAQTGITSVGTLNGLTVSEGIKIGSSAATCSAAEEGTMRYNTTSKTVEFCNGSSWMDTNGCGEYVTDADGNAYNTVKVGSQCWMQQNMRTTHRWFNFVS